MIYLKKFTYFLLLTIVLVACGAAPTAPADEAEALPTADSVAEPVEADQAPMADEDSAEFTLPAPDAIADDATIAPDPVVVVPTAEPEPAAVEVESAESVSSEPIESPHDGPANRLINEKSPYLLQHAYNPVDWYAWGPEAFERARAENKPVFLSIGYSTCHWCHVMRDESFEDPEVAALMNEAFINIKVDREERPDIDGIYMSVAQITGNRGGWPLTTVMTPDQLPFFSATYIPKETRFERIGMLDLIPRIEEAWSTDQAGLLEYADAIVDALQSQNASGAENALFTSSVRLDSETTGLAYQQLAQRFDPEHGGFGTSPKFPTPHNMLFLLRYWQRTGDDQALLMVEKTLREMRQGGVYDQLGYGFHRYSTDAEWKLPHFEKMLYDQAMLSMAYIETYQATDDPFYQEIAREIFTYVLRDMTDPMGGFYSAEDADSEGEEGVFYIWEVEEMEQLLAPEDAQLMVLMSGMTEVGNFIDEGSRQPIGENIIYWSQDKAALAGSLGLSEAELETRYEAIRQQLWAIREERIHPHKDDKILTDWNGLMIAALAKAGRAFEEPAYVEAAANSADFLLATMRDDDGRLLHRYRAGEAGLQANIDDYAFLVWGLLELYEATFNLTYLEEALALNAELYTYFWDDTVGGFYFTADDAEQLLTRQKEVYDGAIPSGNSVAMSNMLRLGRITADAVYESQAYQITQAFEQPLTTQPMAHTQMMNGLEFGIGPSYEVIIVGEPNSADTNAMLAALRDQYVPNKVVLLREFAEDGPLTELADYTKYYYAIDDKATAYVCQNYVCEFPTNDPAQMVNLLLNSTVADE